MTFILLVTLISTGQRPYSYHLEFYSEQACEAAHTALADSYEHNFKTGLNYSIICLHVPK